MNTDWWTQLAPRERNLVAVCGVFIVGALIWTLGIQPLYKGSAKLAEQVVEKESQLANLQELASQISPGGDSKTSATASTNESIVVVIDKTTRSRSLAAYLKRNQPEGTNGVRLRFEGAPFDVLVQWIGELNKTYGMSMVSASFDDAGTGRVNCSIVLNRPDY
jgi:type II secretory pathway component PulM